MRLQFPALAVAVLTLAGCGAHPEGPAAELPESRYEFGKVRQGARVEHGFAVRNPGTADLAIREVVAGPEIVVTFDKVVKPGGEGAIWTVLDTSRIRKSGELSLTVRTNDPENPETKLVLAGQIEPLVEVSPEGRIDFSAVKGTGGEQRLTLVNRGEWPLDIRHAVSDNPLFHAAVAPVPGEKGRWQVVITLDAAAPAGRHEGLVVVPTGLSLAPHVEIPVRAEVKEPR